MARIIESDVDIFSTSAEAYVNPVNCKGVMGAGLAQQFAWRYPTMLEKYKDACKRKSLKPGGLFICKVENKTIVNFATKDHWKDQSQYAYIEFGMQALRIYLNKSELSSIAIPKIGCGLGALDYGTVKAIILREAEKINDSVKVYLV